MLIKYAHVVICISAGEGSQHFSAFHLECFAHFIPYYTPQFLVWWTRFLYIVFAFASSFEWWKPFFAILFLTWGGGLLFQLNLDWWLTTVFPQIVPVATNYFRAKKVRILFEFRRKKKKTTTTAFRPETSWLQDSPLSQLHELGHFWIGDHASILSWISGAATIWSMCSYYSRKYSIHTCIRANQIWYNCKL